MFKIITSMAIIASQSSLEKRREVTLMMLPDGLLSWRQRRSRRLCLQECHLHNHQRQSRQKRNTRRCHPEDCSSSAKEPFDHVTHQT